jgi:hypothetical protein
MLPFKRKKGKKAGPVKSKAVLCDGVAFKSGLEKNMHLVLKSNGIDNKYESMKFQLVDSFVMKNTCYERQANGKGEFQDRGQKKVQGTTYTPDFIIYNSDKDIVAIIETKGRANEAFPIKWKIFRQQMSATMPEVLLFKPQNIAECETTAKKILEILKK